MTSKDTGTRKTLPSLSERPDLYDSYDGRTQSAVKNPIAVPVRLAELLRKRSAQVKTSRDQSEGLLKDSSLSFAGFAAEVQRMSKEAIEQTTQAMEKVRGAKSVEEVVSIQSNYMQQAFASYTDYTRRFSELMMALPMEFAREGRAAVQQRVDAATSASEQTGAQMTDITLQFEQQRHH